MTSERLNDGYAFYNNLKNQNELLLAHGKLWLFGLQFKNQPTHNFGNHVVHVGSYVLIFDLLSKKWNHIEFKPIIEEENLSEVLFTHNDEIYLLLFTNFGAIDFKHLFKWDNDEFKEINLSSTPSISIDPQVRVNAVKALSSTNNSEAVVIVNGDGLRVFKLKINNDNSASINFVIDLENYSRPFDGRAVSGLVSGQKLAVGYGIHGCGFRWEAGRHFVIDLETKKVDQVEVENASDFEKLPKFGFSGPLSHSDLGPRGWLHAGGSNQIGMCDSKFDGSVWVLKNVFDKPTWEKLEINLPEASIVANENSIYTVSPTDVIRHNI